MTGETKRHNPAYAWHKQIVIAALEQQARLPTPDYIEQCIDCVITMTEPPFNYTMADIERLVPAVITAEHAHSENTGFTVLFRTERRQPWQHPVGRMLRDEREREEAKRKASEPRFKNLSDLPDEQAVAAIKELADSFGVKAKVAVSHAPTTERAPTDAEVEKADAARQKIKQQLELLTGGTP